MQYYLISLVASNRNQFWLTSAKTEFIGRIKRTHIIEGTAKEPSLEKLALSVHPWDLMVRNWESERRSNRPNLGQYLTLPSLTETCWYHQGGLSGARSEGCLFFGMDLRCSYQRRIMKIGGSKTTVCTTVPISQMRKSSCQEVQWFIQKTIEVKPGL